MTDLDLQTLLGDENAFFNAMRKDTTITALQGRFSPGRTSYLHTVTLDDGSRIVVKFVNTIKHLINSKLQRIPGKESFLTYIEITGAPAGKKGFNKTFDVKQIPITAPRTIAQAKHDAHMVTIIAQAEAFGIDLTTPGAWCTAYSENY